MNKTYKHKKLYKRVAMYNKKTLYYDIISDGKVWVENMPAVLIENSDDWVLQEEKDWIDKVCDSYNAMFLNDDFHLRRNNLRRHIEKHMPKITAEDLEALDTLNRKGIIKENLVKLLKERGLYKE